MVANQVEIALKNMERLKANPYPGRGLVLGTDPLGLYGIQIYWIMGRSENSRNRVFNTEDGRLFTEAADPSKVKDPSLIIYNAMGEVTGDYVVSNGDQTDTVIESMMPLEEALLGRQYEPDKPNFTPRITGLSSVYEGECTSVISILRRSETVMGDQCERFYYEYGQIMPGFGRCITTYMGDGDPLPAFTGEPYLVPISGHINEVAGEYWSALNVENRVALAVKFINIKEDRSEIFIINSRLKVPPAYPGPSK